MHPFLEKIAHNTQRLDHHVCLGLDPDVDKMPSHFDKDLNGIYQFLSEVIAASSDLVVAYKPNVAFFEAYGADGIATLKKVRDLIPSHVPVIMDAKRADIGNTSAKQAQYLFDYLDADATTLHPYMGDDSLQPYLEYRNRFHFILCLTSNPGAATFEKQQMADGRHLYDCVFDAAVEWHEHYHNVGSVVGATQDELKQLRQRSTTPLFLIPGVGSQGGDYDTAVQDGKNKDGLVLVNMTRSLLYTSQERDYQEKMRNAILSYCPRSD